MKAGAIVRIPPARDLAPVLYRLFMGSFPNRITLKWEEARVARAEWLIIARIVRRLASRGWKP